MKVADILRVKGGTLFTMSPDQPLSHAVETMAERDIGSLVVMDHGDVAGMLTFREVILAIVKNGGTVGSTTVRSVMDYGAFIDLGGRDGLLHVSEMIHRRGLKHS